ncbi:phosphoribosylanthranilate isomerase [Halothece sp. PCC 7418]|uniref:phosphoribosylanthranilate isomerase n=1 Tax=Halothece sp. (strain PCC 7418) TaxID=65093 RepID=UPI0002A07B58|nr:phosphoribosylanthranilate isomerase [Halothece sp. PCC 7418]AFZ43713.1 phosphoribosylanthranilate isomerase [Halothece sp. PCC 7418]
MRVKICGITNLEQASAIAQLGSTDLGFICVQKSPRYLPPHNLADITSHLPSTMGLIGVFANADLSDICSTVKQSHLTAVQLHGKESPAFCQQLRSQLPNTELIKAIAVKTPDSLTETEYYADWVDTFLLDAYAPQQLGGTGKSFNWDYLQDFHPQRPWFLAGGLTPNNIQQALNIAQPDGIDLSSGVENSPGDKNLDLVAELFQTLQSLVISH